jgi:hypothetical protein
VDPPIAPGAVPDVAAAGACRVRLVGDSLLVGMAADLGAGLATGLRGHRRRRPRGPHDHRGTGPADRRAARRRDGARGRARQPTTSATGATRAQLDERIDALLAAAGDRAVVWETSAARGLASGNDVLASALAAAQRDHPRLVVADWRATWDPSRTPTPTGPVTASTTRPRGYKVMADWLVRQLAAPQVLAVDPPRGRRRARAPAAQTPRCSPACRSRRRRASTGRWTCWPPRWPASPTGPATQGADDARASRFAEEFLPESEEFLARGGGRRARGGGRLGLPAARSQHARGPRSSRSCGAARCCAPHRRCGRPAGDPGRRGPGHAAGRGPRGRGHLVRPGCCPVRRSGPLRRGVPAAGAGAGPPAATRSRTCATRRPPGPRPGESPVGPASRPTEWRAGRGGLGHHGARAGRSVGQPLRGRGPARRRLHAGGDVRAGAGHDARRRGGGRPGLGGLRPAARFDPQAVDFDPARWDAAFTATSVDPLFRSGAPCDPGRDRAAGFEWLADRLAARQPEQRPGRSQPGRRPPPTPAGWEPGGPSRWRARPASSPAAQPAPGRAPHRPAAGHGRATPVKPREFADRVIAKAKVYAGYATTVPVDVTGWEALAALGIPEYAARAYVQAVSRVGTIRVRLRHRRRLPGGLRLHGVGPWHSGGRPQHGRVRRARPQGFGDLGPAHRRVHAGDPRHAARRQRRRGNTTAYPNTLPRPSAAFYRQTEPYLRRWARPSSCPRPGRGSGPSPTATTTAWATRSTTTTALWPPR